jgi:hypothetical protein
MIEFHPVYGVKHKVAGDRFNDSSQRVAKSYLGIDLCKMPVFEEPAHVLQGIITTPSFPGPGMAGCWIN